VILEFEPIAADAIRKRLEYIADQEGLSLNGEIEDIARGCCGDMRLAINELERASYGGSQTDDGDALLQKVRQMRIEA
jgi:DNA polymerase III delta prime subunit